MADLKIKYVLINALIPYARNSRTHSDEQATLESEGRTFEEVSNGG